ncbi:hypothetical protein HDU91_005102 [Kappamyces sp. JEL0680]|nr:hypothetical protein HDU91_005102 [Kappamyces sp. JEL0680]
MQLGRSKPRLYTATFKGTTVLRSKTVGAPVPRVAAPGETTAAVAPAAKKSLTETPIAETLQDLQEEIKAMRPPEHRISSINQAVCLFKRVLPLSEGWTTSQEKEGVSISSLAVPGLDLPFVRGDGLISGGFTVEEVLSVVQNAFSRKTWDHRFDSSEVLEFLSPTDFLIHSVQKGTFPVAARDFVSCSTFYYDSPSVLDYVVTSVEDPLGPPPGTGGRVRAEILLASWRLEQTAEGVAATYLVHVDVKGSIPSAIIRSIQVQTPMCIRRVGEYLESRGTLPFLVNAPAFKMNKKIQIVKREGTDSHYALEFSIPPDVFKEESASSLPKGAITIALPAKSFAGAAISLKTKNGAFHCKVVKEGLETITSKATGLVVQVWSDPAAELITASLSIVPSKAGTVTLNDRVV